jgi:hypothetical protein
MISVEVVLRVSGEVFSIFSVSSSYTKMWLYKREIGTMRDQNKRDN